MRTLSPRDEFLKGPQGQAFADLLANPVLVAGIRAAFLEYQFRQAYGRTMEEAMREHYHLQGAKDFTEFLLTFIDPEPARPKPEQENLKWPTKQSLTQRPPPQPAQGRNKT